MNKVGSFAGIGFFEVTDEELEKLEYPHKRNYFALLREKGAPINGYLLPTIAEGFLITEERQPHKASVKISWRRTHEEENTIQPALFEK